MKKAMFYYQDENAPKPNKPNHIGTSAIIKFQDKILLEKRADSERWGLIGGGLNVTESLEQGIMREIKEETGLCINHAQLQFLNIYSDPSRIAAYPDGFVLRIITATYLVELREAHKLTYSNESEVLRYFSAEEIPHLKIAETQRHILMEYLNDEA